MATEQLLEMRIKSRHQRLRPTSAGCNHDLRRARLDWIWHYFSRNFCVASPVLCHGSTNPVRAPN